MPFAAQKAPSPAVLGGAAGALRAAMNRFASRPTAVPNTRGTPRVRSAWPAVATRYGAAAAGVVVVALAAHHLTGHVPEILLSIPIAATAVIASALGAGPAALFMAGVALAIWYCVLEPRGTFALANDLQLADLGFYFLAAIPVTIVIGLLQRERRELQAARMDAAESRDRLALAQEIARIGTFELDLETKAAQWSPELETLYGVRARRSIHPYDQWMARVHPEDREGAERQIARALESGTFEGEWRVLRPDGSVPWIAGRGRVFRDASGKPVRLLGAHIDITRQKEDEEILRRHEEALRRSIAELRRAEQALREADRRKDEFLAVLSHELRNPLAPVRNALHILTRAEPGGAHAAAATTVIARQVDHLARLVDDLLDVTHITRGKVRLQRERVDLGELVRRTVEDHQGVLAARGVALDVCIRPGPFPADADPTRIAQIVGNILQNGAKFTAPGGRVAVVLERADDRAAIRVVDDGIGIAPEMLGRIFEPFTQADESLDRSRGGLGLGLALVKGFVEAHAGAVEARSAGLGRGAEFLVTLPLAATGAGAGRSMAAAPCPSKHGARRVLIVEDNADAAETLRLAIDLSGYEVAVAHDGRSGLEAARAFRPEVILCDIGLPEMDGYSVARALRADPSFAATALVALTGYGLVSDHRRAIEAGFDMHLTKPAPIEDIVEALRTAAPHQRTVA